MNGLVMSGEYPCFVSAVQKLGFNVLTTDEIYVFPAPERRHADMQLLEIDGNIFILSECKGLIDRLKDKRLVVRKTAAGGKYPECTVLNFLYWNNMLFGRTDFLDENVLEYCEKASIKLIKVNQGYTRCSVLRVGEDAFITSDKGLAETLEANGAKVLQIREGSIRLEGYPHGFIGGAGGLVEDNRVLVFGNIKVHPDFELIHKFCIEHNSDLEILCEDQPLTDIGGIVKL